MEDLTPTPPGAVVDAVQASLLEIVSRCPRLPASLRISAGDVTVEVEWAAEGSTDPDDVSPPPASNPPPAVDDRVYVRSPTAGAFFQAPEPGARPFVEVGDSVTAGQQVAIVESMKLMFAVHAETDGTVLEILAENGAVVGEGDSLIALAENH